MFYDVNIACYQGSRVRARGGCGGGGGGGGTTGAAAAAASAVGPLSQLSLSSYSR